MATSKASCKAKKRAYAAVSIWPTEINLPSIPKLSLKSTNKSNCDLILGRKLEFYCTKMYLRARTKTKRKNMTNSNVTEADREGLFLHS